MLEAPVPENGQFIELTVAERMALRELQAKVVPARQVLSELDMVVAEVLKRNGVDPRTHVLNADPDFTRVQVIERTAVNADFSDGGG